MSAPTRERITDGCVDLSFRVPAGKAEMVKRVMRALLAADDPAGPPEERMTPEEVFGPSSPAKTLRGYRYREALTQARLAKLVGVTAQNISDMECGRRGIGKEMARKLGEALNAPWERFL
ncbi:MAG: helix-turn-helix transcriptional regulator [Thermodesulfobacteriota bacterium]